MAVAHAQDVGHHAVTRAALHECVQDLRSQPHRPCPSAWLDQRQRSHWKFVALSPVWQLHAPGPKPGNMSWRFTTAQFAQCAQRLRLPTHQLPARLLDGTPLHSSCSGSRHKSLLGWQVSAARNVIIMQRASQLCLCRVQRNQLRLDMKEMPFHAAAHRMRCRTLPKVPTALLATWRLWRCRAHCKGCSAGQARDVKPEASPPVLS